MVELTGVLAVVLVFLSGPYRTLQKRLPRRWGPVLSVWAHGNVSLVAAMAVFVHLIFVGEIEFEDFSLSDLGGSGLTWIATLLFATSVVSGLSGLYVFTGPRARRRWLSFHRRLTSVFYLAIVPHVLTEGVLGWPVFLLAVSAWGIALGRLRLRAALSRASWPLAGRRREAEVRPRRTMRAARAPAALLLSLAVAGALFATFISSEEGGEEGGELELTGRVAEVHDGVFTLEATAGAVRVRISSETRIEGGVDLASLQRQRALVKVEGARAPDGTVLATEVELESGESADD